MNKYLNAAVIFLGVTGSCWSAEFHVEPNGKPDGTGTAEAPFATILQARNAARELKKSGKSEPVTIWIHGGTYELKEPVVLDVADSGTAEAPVVYRSVKGEKVQLTGARKVEGFAPHEGKILKADVSALGLKDVTVRQLLFDGERQPLARYPNVDAADPLYGGWAFLDEIEEAKKEGHSWKTEAYLKPVDIRKFARPEEVEINIFAGHGWWNFILPIKSIDAEAKKLTLAKPCGYDLHPHNRYFLQNAIEELDAPGEWYLDKTTQTVYFWPPADLAGKEVRIPAVESFFKLSAGTKFVTIRGLSLTGCNGTAIALENTENCTIAANTIAHVGAFGGSGISISGKNNRAVGNDISYTGNSGINLGGGDRKTLTSAGNVADNNHIHHVGALQKNGPGISIVGVGNEATHNHIHHTPRMAIQFGGNNLVIEYNHMHHTVQETQDGGAVYTGGRDWTTSRGTKLRYNFIHDTIGVGQEKEGLKHPFFTWGIYMDDNAGGLDIIGNIVARSARGSIHLHNGRDHIIENNIFLNGGECQIEYGGWNKTHSFFLRHHPTMIEGWDQVKDEPVWKKMRGMDMDPRNVVREDGTLMSGNVIERNIIAWEDASIRYVTPRNFSPAYNKMDKNLVWNGGKEIKTLIAKAGPDTGSELLAEDQMIKSATNGTLPKGWGWTHKAKPDAKFAVEEGILRIEAANSSDPKNHHSCVHGPNLTVKPGAAYRTRLRVKGTEPTMRVGFSYGIFKNGGGYWQSETSNIAVTNEWQDIEVTGTMLPQSDPKWKPWMTDFWLRVDVMDDKGEILIENVSTKEAEPLDSWKSWQLTGWDQHSIIADPMFENAAKDDYRVKKDSPAFKVGFEQIPTEKIGLYQDELRASWPSK